MQRARVLQFVVIAFVIVALLLTAIWVWQLFQVSYGDSIP